MPLLFDMNLTAQWVDAFKGSEHQVFHWSAIGKLNAADAEIFQFAKANDFVIVTTDLDFPALLAYTAAQKPSVILLRGQPLVPNCGRNLCEEQLRTVPWN